MPGDVSKQDIFYSPFMVGRDARPGGLFML